MWEGAMIANQARRVFLEVGDRERAMQAFVRASEGLDRVPTASELAGLDEAIASTEAAFARVLPPGQHDWRLDRAIARIAWWRGQLDEVHRR